MIVGSTLNLPRVTVTHEPRPARAEKRPARPSAVNWWGVYEAAERNDFRGWFYLPTLDVSLQQNSWTRRALTERIDFLYKNVGAVTQLIDGLALEEVGTGLWPKWITSSPAFNKAMTDLFHYTNHDPRVFSADGESDYYTAQFNIRRMIRLYGDSFGQLLRPAPGSTFPQCAFIPGWRVDDVPSADGRWRDGILRNDRGRRLAVRVNSGDLGADPIEVPAEDMLHFHDGFLPGQNRGVSCLASVAKRLFRREDIHKALSNGTLLRERLGFALEYTGGTDKGPTIEELTGEGEAETIAAADGGAVTLKKIFGNQADEDIQIPRLPEGTKLNTVESNRPGTAVMEFNDSILREAAWSSPYPPEYVFFIGGMGQGTVARLVLQRVVSIVRSRRQFQLIPQFCQRWNVFFAWQCIKAGLLDKAGVPDDWWRHKLLADADKSVDIGREGRLLDDRVATGKMDIDHYHSLAGEDGDDVEDANMSVFKRRMGKLQALNQETEAERLLMNMPPFTYWDLWPRSVNNMPTPPDSGGSDTPPPSNAGK